jgi:hypothetical protein
MLDPGVAARLARDRLDYMNLLFAGANSEKLPLFSRLSGPWDPNYISTFLEPGNEPSHFI